MDAWRLGLERQASSQRLLAQVSRVLPSAPSHSRKPNRHAGKVPELASAEFAWLVLGVNWDDPPPGLGRGPIRQDPAHPFHGNRDGPGQVTPHLGNAKDPVLKPWAAKQMQESNEEVLSGKRALPFAAQSACYPGGVPEQLLTPAQPFYFIQTPKMVWMIWESDHMVRRITMTDRHSEHVKPSWFGESIGHYESDGTLVDRHDRASGEEQLSRLVPHAAHREAACRRALTSSPPTARRWTSLVKVEDPDTFNEPLYMARRWNKVPNQRLEMVCAENNDDQFGGNLFPIPRADTPDF